MKVYVQDAEGAEVELDVKEPDPKDGTFCAFVPENHLSNWVSIHKDGSIWIRICPND